MDLNTQEKGIRNLNQLLVDLCEIILVDEDSLSLNRAESYISSIRKEERLLLEQSNRKCTQEIRFIVLGAVTTYIQRYQSNEQKNIPIFSYIGDPQYITYKEKFCDFYFETLNKEDSDIDNEKDEEIRPYEKKHLPFPLFFTLNYIWEITEQYYIFQHFYDVKSAQSLDSAISEARKAAETVSMKAVEKGIEAGIESAVHKATQTASESAQKASESAQISAHKAENAADDAVKTKMLEVTEKISETSVTILGIFAGIVLTIVAGLFYSSSVIGSASTTEPWKLVMIASIVGLVCFDLLAVMFNYIDKFRKKDNYNIPQKLKKESSKAESTIETQSQKESKVPVSIFKAFVSIFRTSILNVKKSMLWEKITEHAFVIVLNILLCIIFIVASCNQSSETTANQTQQENSVSSEQEAGSQDMEIEMPTTPPNLSLIPKEPIAPNENTTIRTENETSPTSK